MVLTHLPAKSMHAPSKFLLSSKAYSQFKFMHLDLKKKIAINFRFLQCIEILFPIYLKIYYYFIGVDELITTNMSVTQKFQFFNRDIILHV